MWELRSILSGSVRHTISSSRTGSRDQPTTIKELIKSEKSADRCCKICIIYIYIFIIYNSLIKLKYDTNNRVKIFKESPGPLDI